MRVAIYTLGCKVNQYETQAMEQELQRRGHTLVDFESPADAYIINTCSVTAVSDKKSRQMIRRAKSRNPQAVVAACGCYVQTHTPEAQELGIDLIGGTGDRMEFLTLLEQAAEDHRSRVAVDEALRRRTFEVLPAGGMAARTRAMLKVEDGCVNFCTYCIVPYVRGRERSRQPEVILREVQHLIQDGYKEIMLLGQNVNSYGKDLEQPISFAELLRKINAMEGEFVIRFMSSHPKDATPELLDTILSCEKVGQHLHLPVQCGSDAILSAMNRRYTVEQYLNIVDYLRERRPDFSLTSDLIVGFPNESEADFQGTLDLIQRVQYDNLYTFIYSKRSGTKAANMPDATSDAEKRQRMERLLTLQREIATKNYKRFLGRTMRVLVEGDSKRGDGWLFGKSNEAIIVEFMGNRSLIGTFVSVQITESKNWAVSGRLLDDERKEAVQK